MDTEPFDSVYARLGPPLRGYLLRLGGSLALADDVLQETFCRYLAMEPAARDRLPVRPLLYRMATHAMYDAFRKLRRDERAEAGRVVEVMAIVPEASEVSGLRVDLERVLAQLEPRERALVWLAYVEGWTHAEIAGALDVGRASVRVLLFRAKRKLAALMRARGLDLPRARHRE